MALTVLDPELGLFINTFMNLVKRSSKVGGTRGGVRASGGVKASIGASLLPTLDLFARLWVLASSSSSSAKSTKVWTQSLRRIERDLEAITKVWSWCYSFKRTCWLVGYGAFRIVKWSTYEITLDWTRWRDAQCERKNGHVIKSRD